MSAVVAGAQGDHRGRHERQAAHDQAEEGALGVRGVFGVGVQLLQFLHGREAQRGSGVSQAEQVGGEGHGDRAEGRMVPGHAGEEADQQGTEQARDDPGQARFLGHPHQAGPEGNDAHQADDQGDRPLGRTQDARGHRFRPPLRQAERDPQPEQEAPDEIEQGCHLVGASYCQSGALLYPVPMHELVHPMRCGLSVRSAVKNRDST